MGIKNRIVSGGTYYQPSRDFGRAGAGVAFQPNGSSTTPLQVAEYYPFGSNYTPLSPDNSNKYLYNGKEKQTDLLGSVNLDWYDYGARFYDPALGRWHTPDPMANLYYGWTSYNYALNNPIVNFDPNGMWVETETGWSTDDPDEIKDWWRINVSTNNQNNQDNKKKDDKDKGFGIEMINEAFLSLFFKDDIVDAPDYIKEKLPFQGQKSPREVRGPDMFGFYVGGHFFFVQGGGIETGVVWVRDDKGGMFITVKGGPGGDVSAGGGIMLGWYQGSKKATLESLSGVAFYIDKSGNVIDIGGSVDYNPTLKQTGRQWATISIGVSEGIFKQIPGGGGSIGVSGTTVIPFK